MLMRDQAAQVQEMIDLGIAKVSLELSAKLAALETDISDIKKKAKAKPVESKPTYKKEVKGNGI